MKARAFYTLLFAGLTAWAALADQRLVLGFACLALGQLSLLLVWADVPRGHKRLELLWGFLALTYLGLALLVAAVVGTTTSGPFWIVFAVVIVIFSPVVLLARRALTRA